MEETTAEDCNCERREPPLSNCKRLLTESRSGEHDGAVDRRWTGSCGHFSIRGYVSEMRKRDWRTCWPFFVPEGNNKEEDHTNLRPPIPVAEFRWWNCQNCLKNTNASQIEVQVNCFGDKEISNATFPNRSANVPSCDNSPNSSYRFGQINGHASDQGIEVDKDILRIEEKEKEAAIVHTLGGGTSDGIVRVPNYPVMENMSGINKGKFYSLQEAGPSKTGVVRETGEKTLSLDLNEPLCNLSSSENAATSKPICHESDALEDGVINSKGNEIIKYCKQDCHSQRIPNSGLNREVSMFNKDNLGLIGKNHAVEDYTTPQATDIGTKVSKFANSVANPVNELDSMVLDEGEDVLPGNSHSSIKTGCLSGSSHGSLQRKATRKIRLLTEILKSEKPSVSGQSNINSIKAKKKKSKRMLAGETTEAPLVCRPEDVFEKVLHHKGSAEVVVAETIIVSSESKLESNDKRLIVGKKKDKMESYEDKQAFLIRSMEDISTGVPKAKDTDKVKTHRMSCIGKKKGKICRVELLNSRKDLSGISKLKGVTDCREYQKVVKNAKPSQIDTDTHEEAAWDDIPMDIVELLARNQMEKRLRNSEETSERRNNQSETSASTKVPNFLNFTEKNMETSDKNLHYPSINKEVKNIDLNVSQTERSFSLKGFVPWSQPQENTGRVQCPVVSRHHDNLSFSCTQFLEECHKNQMASQQNSCGQAHYDGPLVPQPMLPLDVKTAKGSAAVNARGSCSIKFSNLNGSLQPQKRKLKIISEADEELFSPYVTSIAEKGNICGPKVVGTMDLCPNETIPALHLLKLMDQGACLRKPANVPLDENRLKFLHQSHFPCCNSCKFFELETGEAPKAGGSILDAKSFECIHQKQCVGDTFEFFAPLPSGSTVVSSLVERPTNSTNFRCPVGFSGEFPPGLLASSRITVRKEQRKRSHVCKPTIPQGFLFSSDLAQQFDPSPASGELMAHKMDAHKKNEMALPLNLSRDIEICTFNRNPAEFSIPEAGNIYMIGSEDLKRRNISPLKDVDGRKRQKTMKLTAIQGH